MGALTYGIDLIYKQDGKIPSFPLHPSPAGSSNPTQSGNHPSSENSTESEENSSQKGMKVRFHNWDVSGSQRYYSFLDNYCHEIDGCLLFYDISKKDALDELKEPPWIKTIRKFDRTNTVVGLIGLKSDLSSLRKVSTEEGSLFAKTQAFDFFMEASSYNDTSSLVLIYQKIASLLIDRNGKFLFFLL